jgi:hypothetical protein
MQFPSLSGTELKSLENSAKKLLHKWFRRPAWLHQIRDEKTELIK